MKKIIIYAFILLLLSGCGVSRFKQQNWMPNDSYTSEYFYRCLKNSQQVESTAVFGGNQYNASGYASSAPVLNERLFMACMESKGYYLRPLTSSERVTTILTLPIVLPLTLVDALAGQKGFSDHY